MGVPSSLVRRAVVATAVAAALAVVSGCGVSAQKLRPGVAADIDGSTISVHDVDTATHAFCTALSKVPQGAPITGAAGRQAMLEGLVLRRVAELVDEQGGYGFSPTSSYDSDVASAKSQLAGLSSSQIDDLLPAYTGESYFVDILTQVGEKQTGLTAAQDTQGKGLQAGITAARAFIAKHPIDTDPAFETIDIGAESVLDERTDLATAASSFARAADSAASEPTPTGAASSYIESLPVTQQCG